MLKYIAVGANLLVLLGTFIIVLNFGLPSTKDEILILLMFSFVPALSVTALLTKDK